jgi:hypothetical protein
MRRHQILAQQSFANLEDNMETVREFSLALKKQILNPEADYLNLSDFGASRRDNLSKERDLEGFADAIDGQAFDRRFSEKIVLVLDSFLEYISGDSANIECHSSLKTMIERVRYGLKEEEVFKYLPYLDGGGGLSREEWLSEEEQQK